MKCGRWICMLLAPTLLLWAGGCDRSRPLSADESLRRAAEQGGMGRVQRALARGANVNSRGRGGNTALHGAARGGHVAIARLLIARGANIDAINDSRQTPVHDAISAGQAGTTRLLLECGAGDDGSPNGLRGTLTPLVFSCWNTEVLELLIAHGAEVNARREGETPLHFAATYDLKDVAACLLWHGADPNATDDSGQTPAMIALERNAAEMARLLMPPGTDVGSIHLAAFVGDHERVEAFLQSGVDVNEPLAGGTTPLHLAAREGHSNVVEVLIAHFAPLDVRDRDENTPLFLAASGGHTRVVSVLVAAGADINGYGPEAARALHVAASHGHREIAGFLLARGAKVNAGDFSGRTPLHYAAGSLQVEVVDLLIAHGANVAARATWGETPLHEVVSSYNWGDRWNGIRSFNQDQYHDVRYPSKAQIEGVIRPLLLRTIESLVRHGADVNAKDADDRTPLHWAAKWNLVDVVEALLENGAQIDAADYQGETPLHEAPYWAVDTIELLVCWGADVRVKDRNGDTPLDLARRRGDVTLQRLLTPPENGPNQPQ